MVLYLAEILQMDILSQGVNVCRCLTDYKGKGYFRIEYNPADAFEEVTSGSVPNKGISILFLMLKYGHSCYRNCLHFLRFCRIAGISIHFSLLPFW